MQRELIENIKKINNEISDACSSIQKSKDDITLIAVSKRKGYQLIELALENVSCCAETGRAAEPRWCATTNTLVSTHTHSPPTDKYSNVSTGKHTGRCPTYGGFHQSDFQENQQ